MLCCWLLVQRERAHALMLHFAVRARLDARCCRWSSSPLHDAAAKGQASVIESLVSQGADVDALNE